MRLVAYLRGQSGAWDFWAQSPTFFPASSGYTQASWTTPPVPASGTFGSNGLTCPCGGIAVAVSLRQVGSFTADDLNLSDSDTTPPTVTLNTPVDGQTVSGNVTLSASASDAPLPSGQPDEIRQVDFLVNGQIIGSSTTAPYQITWNSSGYTGATITARATDASGNIATSAPATVTVDNTAPQSKASAPASSASNTINVGYTAADDQGGSGLAEVDLYAKGPADSSYTKVASDPSGNGSGTFTYTASEGNGTYAFYTRASDKAGNVEAAHAVPDSSTVVQNGQVATAKTPSLTSSQSISVAFTVAGNGDPSALAQVDLYAKGPGDSTYAKVATDSTGQSSGSFTYPAAEGDGTYSFYALATDRQGNVQPAPASPDSSTRVDTAPPVSQASSAASSGSTAITVNYTASDNTSGSGLASVDLYAKGPGDSSFSKVATDTSGSASGTFSYTASAGDGTYSFYTVAVDVAGNREAAPSAPDATTTLDTGGPSQFTMTNPGAYLHGTVTLSLDSGPTDAGSGVKTVAYQYRLSGTSGGWTAACSATAAPWNCTWNTSNAKDGVYDLRAQAADGVSNTTVASNTPVSVTVDNTRSAAKAVSTQNASGGTAGKIEAGDSVTFTYSETMSPSSIRAGWNGSPTAVQVKVSGSTSNLSVWSAAGTTQTALAIPLALGGAYTANTVTFNATMVQNGPRITVTLGNLVSGVLASKRVTGGTLTWTPSTNSTDLAGNKNTTAQASTRGPAF